MKKHILKKSQAGIVISIVIFLLFITFFVLFQKKHIEESGFSYEDEYAYSVLYALLRSSTNSTDIRCETVSDILPMLFTPGVENMECCGIEDAYCGEFINNTLIEKLNLIKTRFKKSYRWYFEAGIRDRLGYRKYFSYGNESLVECKGNKVAAVNYIGGDEEVKYYVRLLLVKKGERCW